MGEINDPAALEAALAHLATRNYGEEGIPMLVVLDRPAADAAATDASAQAVARSFSLAVQTLTSMDIEVTTSELAHILEWIADESFGPDALARGQGGADA